MHSTGRGPTQTYAGTTQKATDRESVVAKGGKHRTGQCSRGRGKAEHRQSKDIQHRTGNTQRATDREESAKVLSTEQDNAQEKRGKAEHKQSKDDRKQQEFYKQWCLKLLYQDNCKRV